MLTLTPLPGIPHIQAGDDLAGIMLNALKRAQITLIDGDILVVAQKIVSKMEGRRVQLSGVVPPKEALRLAKETEKDPRLVALILQESKEVLRTRPGLIIVEHRLGFVCANAGIDHSNVEGGDDWVLLLPENPDASAQMLKDCLEEATGVRLAVLIIDSHGRAWRMGTVGVAIGLAGMPGLVDLRGQEDLFGYRLQVTQVGAADELAAAASLVMGQSSEGTPVVHVRGFPYPLREGTLGELLRPREMDLFR
jgi:coenzyme F420-0:L-glutamate ligase/coenzyme F420-1:gamma-L-glutamate ligase